MDTTIIMVHYDHRLLEETRSALELAGYHVTALSDPHDALTALDNAWFDILIVSRMIKHGDRR